MRLLTAIPVYNEKAHVGPILAEIKRYADDILVVDDGSSDGTADVLATIEGIRVVRHETNQGYGAALATAFAETIEGGYEGLVTLDCDGQHQPCRIAEVAAPLDRFDVVSGSRYLKVFDPDQAPPEARRRINVEVTRWLNRCLDLGVTDAFCGFKAYRSSALERLQVTDFGYAMPLEIWVQIKSQGLSLVEVAVPLIYLDESRAFGGSLDDADYRLRHYRSVFRAAMARAGLAVKEGCA